MTGEAPLRTATSPDGVFVLDLFVEDDYYLGFREHPWHTHGDLLVPEYGATPLEAALAFFDAVIGDRELICIGPEGPVGRSVSVTQRLACPDELLIGDGDVRTWSGGTRQP